jgi:hypothetical protein
VGLAAVAAKLNTQDARKVCAQVAEALVAAIRDTKNSDTRSTLSVGLVAVAAKLSTEDAQKVCGQAAEALVAVIRDTKNSDALVPLPESLMALAGKLTSGQLRSCAVQLVELLNTGSRRQVSGTLGTFAAKLSDKDLIEILKTPLCVGEARTIILKELTKKLKPQHPFTTDWEFVDWVQENRKDLEPDLVRPPVRPEPLVPVSAG